MSEQEDSYAIQKAILILASSRIGYSNQWLKEKPKRFVAAMLVWPKEHVICVVIEDIQNIYFQFSWLFGIIEAEVKRQYFKPCFSSKSPFLVTPWVTVMSCSIQALFLNQCQWIHYSDAWTDLTSASFSFECWLAFTFVCPGFIWFDCHRTFPLVEARIWLTHVVLIENISKEKHQMGVN